MKKEVKETKVVEKFILENKRLPKHDEEIWDIYKNYIHNDKIISLRKKFSKKSRRNFGNNCNIADLIVFCDKNRKLPSAGHERELYLLYKAGLSMGNRDCEKIRLRYGKLNLKDIISFCDKKGSLPNSRSKDPVEVRIAYFFIRHRQELAFLLKKYLRKNKYNTVEKVRSFIITNKRLPKSNVLGESSMYHLIWRNKKFFIDLLKEFGNLETDPKKVAISDMKREGLLILDNSILEEGRT